MAKPEDEVEETEGKKKKSKVFVVVLVVFLSLLILGGAVVGTLYFAGVLGQDDTEQAADDEDAADDEEYDEDEEDAQGPAIYLPLEPAFVVNFQGQNRAKFLQVTIEIMTRDQHVVDLVSQHMPAIRNSLILLFSSQAYEEISTAEGKEALREKALEEVQAILEEETGDPGIEAVYFTSFVMQ
jgi:flagellar FliL protein